MTEEQRIETKRYETCPDCGLDGDPIPPSMWPKDLKAKNPDGVLWCENCDKGWVQWMSGEQ